MDKAIRGALVGRVFQLQILEWEAYNRSLFEGEREEGGYDYKDCAAQSSQFLQDVAYYLFGEDLPQGMELIDGSACPRAFLGMNHSLVWRIFEKRFRQNWLGRSDQELRKEYVRLRMCYDLES